MPLYETTVRRGGVGTPGKKVRGVPARTEVYPRWGVERTRVAKGGPAAAKARDGAAVCGCRGPCSGRGTAHTLEASPAACGFGADESGAALGAGGPTRSPEPTRSGDALRPEGGGARNRRCARYSPRCAGVGTPLRTVLCSPIFYTAHQGVRLQGVVACALRASVPPLHRCLGGPRCEHCARCLEAKYRAFAGRCTVVARRPRMCVLAVLRGAANAGYYEG